MKLQITREPNNAFDPHTFKVCMPQAEGIQPETLREIVPQSHGLLLRARDIAGKQIGRVPTNLCSVSSSRHSLHAVPFTPVVIGDTLLEIYHAHTLVLLPSPSNLQSISSFSVTRGHATDLGVVQ